MMTRILQHPSRQIEQRAVTALRPLSRNARTHSVKQIKQIARSIERFGFTNPVLIDDDGQIIAGHGRVAAAQSLGMKTVPTVSIGDLSAADRKAYALADNQLALNAGWDRALLALELQELIDLDFDLEITGFSLADIDLVLDEARDSDPNVAHREADIVPPMASQPVSRMGDLWQLGRHQLLCGDARSADDIARLMDGAQAGIVFTDPPYNVPIDGHVCGMGRVRHREFAMGAGEMSREVFTQFLTTCLGRMATQCRSGAILYVCMDWRHLAELSEAGDRCDLELKNLVVWNKSNGGMGTFYRSKHELIFVFKHGDAPHVNSFGLGDTGRYRTNVWDYPGISSVGAKRDFELAMHPTVKPVALIADALRDCSRRGDIVLDPFGGSGSTLIAAEQTGRTARLIEYDPLYCDTILRRYTAVTGKDSLLAASGAGFDAVADDRNAAITLGHK